MPGRSGMVQRSSPPGQEGLGVVDPRMPRHSGSTPSNSPYPGGELLSAGAERPLGMRLLPFPLSPFLLLALLLAAGGAAAQPVRVIFDTDLGPDADDAGALALLHALADRGEAEILGV